MSGYVPLWVKSNFSFLEGASHPEELVDRACAFGLPALALTDRDGVYGVAQALIRAREQNLRLLVGAEVTLDPERETGRRSIVLLAETRLGYAHLCQLISRGRARGPKGTSVVSVGELCDAAPGLVALCRHPELLAELHESFDSGLYAACARHLEAAEVELERRLRTEARRLGVKVVAANEILYHDAERQPLHDVLTCVRHGTTLAEAGTRLRQNAEHDLKSFEAVRALFADDPAALSHTLDIAARCTFDLRELRYRYPGERLPDGMGEADWLRALTFEGARARFGGKIPNDIEAQLERELSLINELDYGGYFLTMHEIVRYCREHGILCQGRGSAANSAVCFCLGITAVDPTRIDLLFERFLSRERPEPPDIDLDIEHERREEVIQWVYERYGRRYAAMVANVIRYRARSAVRDVGKALGIPATALDRMSKLLGSYHSSLETGALEHAGLDPQAAAHRHLLELAQTLTTFPRHLSIHPGGFLLGHEPVDTLVPIEPATMEGRTVIQWDKYAVEELGLFKVDLLGLGALTHIHRAFDLLRRHAGVAIDMATVPAEDTATYEMVSRGDTIGVFQIESRAQMSMLPRLRPRTFYDLVIEVAIVRPGPIQGDMVHPYLKRRQGLEQPEYPHPLLEKALAKTLGVPIFQEQVMKVAMLVGGYTPGEADKLRRDMAAWKSSGRIESHRDVLIGRMVQNGVPPDYAERIFSQILGFGEYGFPESHAASFALIAYVTAWLRCHHPAIFTCGLLNAQPMGFYSPATLVEDAKRRGVTVLPIDVQHSRWECTLEGQPFAVRMGLRYVKGITTRERQALEAAPPPYPNLATFARRTRLSERSLERLAEAGALQSFGVTRRDALWSVKALARQHHDTLQLPLFSDGPGFVPLSRAQAIAWDYRTSAHSTHGHPILGLRPSLRARRIPTAREVIALPSGTPTRYVGMAICRQHPATASGVTFYTLEDETGFVNLVVWRQVFERYSVLAQTALLLGVTGEVQSESGVVHIVARELWDPGLTLSSAGTTTRSFR
jgi:error-prone DNA polymerase